MITHIVTICYFRNLKRSGVSLILPSIGDRMHGRYWKGRKRGKQEGWRTLHASYFPSPSFFNTCHAGHSWDCYWEPGFCLQNSSTSRFLQVRKKINANAFSKRLVRFFLFPSKTSKLPLYKPLAFTLYDFAFQSLLSTLSQAKEASDIDRETWGSVGLSTKCWSSSMVIKLYKVNI